MKPLNYLFLCSSLLLQSLCFAQLTVVDSVLVVAEHNAREPMLAEHPNGDLYVTGYANPTKRPQLWKSTDTGKTWNMVDVGVFETGADGNSDMDLVIDSNGYLYLMAMRYTTLPKDLKNVDYSSMKGEHIAIGVSKDEGDTWSWQYLSKNDFDDRPWVTIASDGSAHAIWNDGKGVHYRVSNDYGTTWDIKEDISPRGGSSHLTAGPNALLAVRVSPESASGFVFDKDIDLIFISQDLGKSWTSVPAPGSRNWTPFKEHKPGAMQYWVEPLAFDSKGHLYYLWSEEKTLKLGISKDLGKSWDIEEVYTSENISFFPYLQIKDDKLVCTWLTQHTNMEKMKIKLWHNAAYTPLVDGSIKPILLKPMNLENELNSNYQGTIYPSYGGEYFPATLLSDGNIGIVTTFNDSRTKKEGFTFRRLKIKN